MIDIGVNLASRQFRRDLPEVIARAQQAGVETLLATGTSLSGSQSVLDLCQQFPHYVYATVGVHPHEADGADIDTWMALRALAQHPSVRAIGETGLDFNRNFSAATAQLNAFEQQLLIAAELQLPVFLHERDAFDDQHRLLTRYRNQLCGAVAHCFTGTRQQLHAWLDLDLHIGITGWITDPKRGLVLQSIVADIPDDRLLLETDAPYLMPANADRRGVSSRYKRRNEPALLKHVAQAVASARLQSTQHVIDISSRNARRLFNLPAKLPQQEHL